MTSYTILRVQNSRGLQQKWEDEEWMYYGCENVKSSATFVRARRHLEVLFLNFQFLKIKKRGKWVGKIEVPPRGMFSLVNK